MVQTNFIMHWCSEIVFHIAERNLTFLLLKTKIILYILNCITGICSNTKIFFNFYIFNPRILLVNLTVQLLVFLIKCSCEENYENYWKFLTPIILILYLYVYCIFKCAWKNLLGIECQFLWINVFIVRTWATVAQCPPHPQTRFNLRLNCSVANSTFTHSGRRSYFN